MKKINLKNVVVTLMNKDEFKNFLKGKKCYHHECNWIEEWNVPSTPLTNYFPHRGFLLDAKVKLTKYGGSGYSEKCLTCNDVNGNFIYSKYPMYRVSIRETKKGSLYYITNIGKGRNK